MKSIQHNDYSYIVSTRCTFNRAKRKHLKKLHSKLVTKHMPNKLLNAWKNKGGVSFCGVFYT